MFLLLRWKPQSLLLGKNHLLSLQAKFHRGVGILEAAYRGLQQNFSRQFLKATFSIAHHNET